MKIAITGGHIAPALAVIDALPKDVEVVFLGRKHPFEGEKRESFEYQEITKRSIQFYDIPTGRLQRSFTSRTIPSLLRFPKGFFVAKRILSKEKPDVVLSFGGYIGLPVILASSVLSIPSVIHEQTFGVGLANKIAGRFATKIAVSFPQTKALFPSGKTIITGLPMRKAVVDASKKPHRAADSYLFITGGSGGSHVINELVYQVLPKLLAVTNVVHQTGDSQFDDFQRLTKLVSTLPKKEQDNYTIAKFYTTDEQAQHLTKATMVVGRSGINTVSELYLLNKPVLFLPLRVGQKHEQLVNARFLRDVGLAEIVDEKVSSGHFFSILTKMLAKRSDYHRNDDSYVPLLSDATEKLITLLYDVAKQA